MKLGKFIKVSTCILCLGTIISSTYVVATENSNEPRLLEIGQEDDIYREEYRKLISFYGFDKITTEKVMKVFKKEMELGRNKEYREKFDLVVSRAVANLSSLEEYCVPFVKLGGNFISYKSGEIEEEVANAKNATFLLGGKLKEVYKFDLYEQKRSFVVIDKVKGTPKTYPRKAGTPTKTPL